MSVNKIHLLGNLGKDPEVRHLDNGKAVANFSIATSESYKNKAGERVTNTEWHNVVLWTPLAEIAEKYLKKGGQVYIEGKLTSRTYDKSDGTKGYITEVVGREMSLIGSKGQQQETPQAEEAEEAEEIDDLPFIVTIPLLLGAGIVNYLILPF